MAMLAAFAFVGVAAQAMTVTYQCTGRRPLTAELTPREGQIHFEGQDWTVTRVPSGREAHYLNRKAGVEVIIKQRDMTFTHGAETLQCFLKSDALPGDAPENIN
jgi:hypothetical protein